MKRSLKDHRLHQHLSQQQLAEQSNVSLRTIQRIESGASLGSPYVVRQLSAALDIEPQNLLFSDKPRELRSENPRLSEVPNTAADECYDDRVKYLNFSTLSVICFPFLNLVVSAAIYFFLRLRLSSERDKKAVRAILSLQILWSFITLAVTIFIPVLDYLFFNVGDILEIPLFLWAYLILVFTLVFITLKTAIDIDKKKDLLLFVPNIL